MDKSINLVELSENIKLAKTSGKDVVMSDEADKAIAMIKVAESQIKEAIQVIREHATVALEPFNAKTLKGKYCTITVSAPRKVNEYSVDEEASKKYSNKEVKYTPNKEAIEEYIENNDGQLPRGVHRNELKRSVSIRLKKGFLDEANDIAELIEGEAE